MVLPVLLALCATVLLVAPAFAAPASIAPDPAAYAVIVGSNPGGEGQETLAFAETDARRVKELLVELGRYDGRNIELLLRPNSTQVLAALERIKARLEAHRTRGEDATFFFYYSGHARARAMNLGADTLELPALRAKLSTLPTTLTIVVLDACQSGAFSRAKGARPAADFSFNSVNSLNTRGLAVIASSSSTELSQESDRLRSSYFTHYLLLGLRGAGDRNADGRVSLDEAYKYAYAETLAATTRTAIGGQHVTLETDLTGRGEVPITYPVAASSRLVLPKQLEGQLLLQTRPHRAVLAEVTKVKGAELRLAIPPGRYETVLRRGDRAWECTLTLGDRETASFDPATCSPVTIDRGTTKGVAAFEEKWAVELAGGFALSERDDEYVRRLDTFGYREQSILSGSFFRWSLGATVSLGRTVSLLARGRLLESRAFDADQHQRFDFNTYALGLGARATAPLAGPTFNGYAQLELGPALATSFYADGRTEPRVDENETFFGVHGAATLGLQWMPAAVGVFLETSYAYAPVISNLVDDTHDSGGLTALLGLRAATRGGP